jgi:hypothetical protein
MHIEKAMKKSQLHRSKNGKITIKKVRRVVSHGYKDAACRQELTGGFQLVFLKQLKFVWTS